LPEHTSFVTPQSQRHSQTRYDNLCPPRERYTFLPAYSSTVHFPNRIPVKSAGGSLRLRLVCRFKVLSPYGKSALPGKYSRWWRWLESGAGRLTTRPTGSVAETPAEQRHRLPQQLRRPDPVCAMLLTACAISDRSLVHGDGTHDDAAYGDSFRRSTPYILWATKCRAICQRRTSSSAKRWRKCGAGASRARSGGSRTARLPPRRASPTGMTSVDGMANPLRFMDLHPPTPLSDA
jgi:hypothetical protein